MNRVRLERKWKKRKSVESGCWWCWTRELTTLCWEGFKRTFEGFVIKKLKRFSNVWTKANDLSNICWDFSSLLKFSTNNLWTKPEVSELLKWFYDDANNSNKLKVSNHRSKLLILIEIPENLIQVTWQFFKPPSIYKFLLQSVSQLIPQKPSKQVSSSFFLKIKADIS